MIDGVTFTMVPDDDDEARRQGFSEELIRDLGPADSGTVIMDPKAGQAYCRSLSWERIKQAVEKARTPK